MTFSATNLVIATDLARARIPVFAAIISKNPTTGALEKKPAFKGWCENATTSLPQLEQYWRDHPDAVPAIELGRAGLLVLDLDRHLGAPDGIAAFKRLNHGHRPAPGPLTLTPTRGVHKFYRQPQGTPFGNSRGELPAGIDVRGHGGFVIAPGAISPYGIWRAHPSKSLADAFLSHSIPVLPAWLAEIIRPPIAIIAQPLIHTKAVKSGRREETWAAAALEGLTAELAATPRGMRNHALNATAYRLGRISARGWLDQAEVKTSLFQCAQANGLVHDDGRRAAWATILSGFNDGLLEPHADLPPLIRSSSSGRSQ
jgi:hypothetical protein